MPLPIQQPGLNEMFSPQQAGQKMMMGLQQMMMAKKMQEQNMQEQSQMMQQSAAKHPLDLAQITQQTEESKARVPFIQQQTQELTNKNTMFNDVPADQRKSLAIQEALRKMDETEMARNEMQLTKILQNPDVDAPTRQKILSLLDAFPKARAERQKHADAVELANIREVGDTTRNAATNAQSGANAKTAAESRLAIQQAKNAQANDILAQVRAGKMTPEQAVVKFNVLAEFELDDLLKSRYQALADQMDRFVKEKEREKANAVPQVDTGRTGGALKPPTPVQTTPRASVNPRGHVADGPKRSPEDTQALDWANANPNDPRAAKIKERLGVK
jgi:hypothetical protein